MPATITRFAPSPTGLLHVGHALAALVARDLAEAAGGEFRLRIEDLDTTRCRPDYAAAIVADLRWLGLVPTGTVLYQSTRGPHYAAALRHLADRDLLYPCFCTRGAIAAEVAGLAAAPHGPEGPLYPGTCRALRPAERTARLAAGAVPAWRLDIAAARRQLPAEPLTFNETGMGPAGEHGVINARPELLGDVVLARRDIGVGYHLACVVDDAAQQISLVSRGHDLHPAAHLQRLLQALLGLPATDYHHHRLVCDRHGRRLAKRAGDASLASLREAGVPPSDLVAALRSGDEQRLLPPGSSTRPAV